MNRYKKSCECEHTEKKQEDICSSMPVSDAFKNTNVQDRLILSRSWLDTDHCGRTKPQCQTVAVSADDFCDFISDKIDISDICELIKEQVPDNGQTIGG